VQNNKIWDFVYQEYNYIHDSHNSMHSYYYEFLLKLLLLHYSD